MSNESHDSVPPLSGWEADAPPQDTAFRQFVLAQTAFQRAAGEALDAEIIETDAFVAVDTGRPATMINFTVVKQPLIGPWVDEAMQTIKALYDQPGKSGFVALFSPLPTPDLSPWGWNLAGHPPIQVRHPAFPLLDTGTVEVRPVTTEADRRLLEQIMVDGFGFEEMRGAAPGSHLGDRLLDDPRLQGAIGSVAGQPVSAAASIVEAGIVNIVMVATVPEGRRKGGGLAVTQAVTRPELGLPAVLFSSDEGRPVYERLGYMPMLRGAFWYRNR